MPLSNPSSTNITFPSSTIITAASIPSTSTAAVNIISSNTARKGATIWNNSTANLYIDFAANPTLISFAVKINAGGYYEVPFNYTGSVNGIWDGTNGSALYRELS